MRTGTVVVAVTTVVSMVCIHRGQWLTNVNVIAAKWPRTDSGVSAAACCADVKALTLASQLRNCASSGSRCGMNMVFEPPLYFTINYASFEVLLQYATATDRKAAVIGPPRVSENLTKCSNRNNK